MANDTADLLCIAPTPSSGAGTVALALALALGLDGAPEYRGAPNFSYFAPPSVHRIFPSSGSRGGGALVHVYGTALSTALVPADADAVMDETYVPDET